MSRRMRDSMALALTEDIETKGLRKDLHPPTGVEKTLRNKRSLFTDQEWFNPELIYEEEEDDDDFSGPEFTWDV